LTGGVRRPFYVLRSVDKRLKKREKNIFRGYYSRKSSCFVE